MAQSSTKNILHVAIPAPLRRVFDYLPPDGGDPAHLQPGIRLRVPFGRGEVIGILLESSDSSQLAGHRLRRVRQILDDTPLLPDELMKLLNWASRYYQHPIGEVMQQALPVLLRQGGAARATGIETWRLTEAGRQLDPASLKRAPRQQHLLALLAELPTGIRAGDLNKDHQPWRPTMARLAEKGWVEKVLRSHLPEACPEDTPLPDLNPEQQQAVSAVTSRLGRFQAFLLDGVTGSGKTEVYLRLIQQVLDAGQQVLVLVPEIGLTPQLLRRFRRRLDGRIAVLHSGLNEQERLNAWLAASKGEAQVVIGTRSAMFIPLARPGLFIIDEEHDLSFKQQEGFRYSARDCLVMRARQLAIPILMGSATPALESLYNCEQGRFERLVLSQRAGEARAPSLRLLDVRSQKLDYGVSARLREAMSEHLARDGQVMLFINRRGFAPVLLCHDCGWHARCERCDAHMTIHQASHRQRCHHCGSERPLPDKCPECGGSNLLNVGYGTERVEQGLQPYFPDVPIIRIDRDTTRRKGSLQEKFDLIHQGGAQILIGTQMLAKGHHFPDLTLVGILDADYGLFSADFRAPERLGQLVLQVAGRAGRASRPGEVLIQTHQPESPLLQDLLSQDYHRFARNLLEERASYQLPPCQHFALLRAEAVDAGQPLQFLHEARQLAQALQASLGIGGVSFFGPFPAPMERRAGRSRAQLLLQAEHRQPLQNLMTAWLAQLEGLKMARKVRWSIDVDPQEMF